MGIPCACGPAWIWPDERSQGAAAAAPWHRRGARSGAGGCRPCAHPPRRTPHPCRARTAGGPGPRQRADALESAGAGPPDRRSGPGGRARRAASGGSGAVPEADPAPLLERCLAATPPWDGWSRLALVGHEPDLSTLAARLVGAPPGSLELRKAGVMLLRLPPQGHPGAAAPCGCCSRPAPCWGTERPVGCTTAPPWQAP